jgi:hypothetical protein
MSQPALPPTFQALEIRLADLRQRYAAGEISAETYQAEVQTLKVQDSAGVTWWLGGESGAWHYWDGRTWVRGNPEGKEPPANRTGAQGSKRSMRPFVMGCGLGLLLVGAIVVAFLVVGWQAYRQEPMIVEGVEPGGLTISPHTLSSDQQNVIDRFGYPEAFSILFYEEEQVGGSRVDVRFETWSYYTSAVEYTFVNGNQEAEDSLEVELVGDLHPIPYHPEQFVAYMSLDEVIASAGLETYLVLPLEKELVEGGEVYYGDELTFGLKDDELLYVEALALELGE